MKILTIGNLYPPHSLGGYEVVWQEAVEYLSRGGHDVRVLTTTQRFSGVPEIEEPMVERRLEWYWREGDWPRLALRERLRIERHNHQCLGERLERFRPDVVTWWGMGGMSLSMIEAVSRGGFPMVFAVCDDWLLYAAKVDAWQQLIRRLPLPQKAIERFTGIPAKIGWEAAGTFVFPSRATRDRALSAGWDLARTRVCHQGVSKEAFAPRAERKAWVGDLVYVGRVEQRKGVDLAIEALQRLPDARLRIVGRGDDDYMATLRDLVTRSGLEERVSFQHSTRRDLVQIYSSADVLLFPVRWQEPWGLVPLEAMSVGVPVVASGRGGSGEYLRDEENCLLVDPDEGPDALAKAVERLARNAPLRERLCAGGYATTARFGQNDFSEAVAEAIEAEAP